ncbi:MAG: radical SAM protein [Candidatus Tritonobacter lacicola]|nr:radical SAM protein [Candidatus Tritonobacter lacicola]
MKTKKRVMKLKYKNFYWAVTWLITYVCNLRCKYCSVTPAREHPDIQKAFRKIVAIKPKHLCISGGEPTLIPDFIDLMKELRARLPNTNIELNTNATLPDVTCKVLPYIDWLAFSIDGVGGINKMLRGVDGDILLETLEKIIQLQVKMNNSFRIAVVPVAVISNYKQMEPLFERLDQLFKRYRNKMCIDVKPMHPYDQPMTVAYDRNIYREFIELNSKLPAKYEIPLSIRGIGDLDPLTDTSVKESVSCFRQYFIGLMTGDGDITTCKPEKYYDYYHDMFFEGGWPEKARAIGGAINELFIHPYCPTCHFPCEHMHFISRPLAMNRASEVLEWASEHNIVLSREEAGEAFRFIRKHLNKDFIIDAP